MKRRKQASTQPPGEEFLRALASGREDTELPVPAPAGGSGLEGRLLETERRAATAEAALEQIRSEAERRLADARDALGREREARLAAEQELGHSQPVTPPEPAPEAAPPEPVADADQVPEPEQEADAEQAAEPEVASEAERRKAPQRVRSEPPSGEEGDNGAWPTPWLGPDRPQ